MCSSDLESPTYPGLLARALRDRRTTLLTTVGGALPALLPHRPPYGGYHLWLRLPDGADETAVTASALRHGVAVTAGSPYFTAEAPAPHLRLSYVSTPGTAQLEEGVHRLSHALAGDLPLLTARQPANV